MKFKAPIEVESSLVDSSNSSGSAGQVLTSTGVGVDWIDPTLLPAESAEKVIQTVRFGEAVSKGDPLVITGYHGSNGPAIVERADATDATKMPAYGVALEDYANNATGLMIAVGDFNDFDTSGYSVGDTLYVAVGGGMTNVKPTGTALIQNMGIVSRSNANNGDVEIVAIGRTNDVPNLPTGRLFVGTATNTSLISDVVYVDDANDRVGIGTTSPNEKLTVAGQIQVTDSSAQARLSLNNTGTGDSQINFQLLGSSKFTLGVDNSDIDKFKISGSSVLGSNDRLVIDSSGNVGIGTTSPQAKTRIFNSLNQDGLVVENSSASFLYSAIFANNTSTTNGNLLRLRSSGSDKMLVLGNGNVGIGTTTPQYKLDVNGDTRVAGAYYDSNNAPGTSGQILSSTATGTNWISGSAIPGVPDGSGTTNYLARWTDADTLGIGTTYDNGTNVGIGTTSPSGRLTIGSGVATDNSTMFNVNGQYNDVGFNGGTSGLLTQGVWSFINSGTWDQTRFYVQDQNNSNSRLTFDFKGNGGNINILAGTSSGNVGIGTTNPEAILHINGTEDTTYWGPLIKSTSTNPARLTFTNTEGSGFIDQNDNALRFYHNGGYRMYINSSGNVGIGTTNLASISSQTRTLTLSGNDSALTGGIAYVKGNTVVPSAYHYVNGANLFHQTVSGIGQVFYANGSEAMRIHNTTKNVGIGTTSPRTKLHVTGLTGDDDPALGSSTAPFFVSNTANSYGLNIGVNNVGASWLQSQSNTSSIAYNLLLNPLGGNVGIGTASPGERLSIQPDADVSAEIGKAHIGNVGYNDYAGFSHIDRNSGTNYALLQEASGVTFLNASATQNIRFRINNTDQMILTGGGNFGIGTTGPTQKLAVSVTDTTQGFTVGAFRFDAVSNYGSSKNILFHRQDANQIVVNEDGADLDFRVEGSSDANLFKVDSGLNRVGIGTPSPSAKLDVVGKVKASGLDIDGTGNADTTFITYTRTDLTQPASIIYDGAGGFKLNANGLIYSFTDNTGLGIGTTSPQEKLHVQNYTTGESHQAMFKGGAVTVGDYSYISLNNGYSTEYNKEVRLAAVAETGSSNKTGFAILTSPDSAGASGHERLRVTADGDVGIGTTSPDTKLHIVDNDCYITLEDNNAASPTFYQSGIIFRENRSRIQYRNDPGFQGLVTSAGTSSYTDRLYLKEYNGYLGIGTVPNYQLQLSLNSAAKPSSIYWTTTSDERVKTNIRQYEKSLEHVVQLNPKLYDYNGKAGFDPNSVDNIGFIAQDIVDIFPEAVKTYKAKLEETDEKETELYNIDFQAITFAMINSIKELNNKIEQLETRIQTLENN